MKIDDIDLAVLDRSKLEDTLKELEFSDKEEEQEFKELSDIIDETIIEEDINKYEELEKILDEELAKVNEEEIQKVEQQVSNNQIYELILSIKKDIYEMKKEDLKADNAIIKRIDKHAEVSNNTNSKLNKTLAIFIGIVFATGVILGTQYTTWTPYMGQLLDYSRTISNMAKG